MGFKKGVRRNFIHDSFYSWISKEIDTFDTVEISPRLLAMMRFLGKQTQSTDTETGAFVIKTGAGMNGEVGVRLVNIVGGQDRTITLEPQESLLPGEEYLGTFHAHPLCIIGKDTKVETSEGSKSIRDIKQNDWVLSYGGEYRKVRDVNVRSYQGRITEIVYNIGKVRKSLTTTYNHPIRVIRGGNEIWAWAETLTPNDELLIPEYLIDFCSICGGVMPSDQIGCTITCANKSRAFVKPKNPDMLCAYCGSTTFGKRKYPDKSKYCSHRCKAKDFRRLGILRSNKFDNFNPEFQRKAKLARFATAKNGSRWESVVYKYLVSNDIQGVERQYPVQIGFFKTYSGTRIIPRFVYMDIAIPSLRVDIEVDGEIWHSRRLNSDMYRDEELSKLGWKVLRIPVRDVASNKFTECLSSVLSVPALVDPPIRFIPIRIVVANTHYAKKVNIYSVSIDASLEDYDKHSYVVGGVLTHNTDVPSIHDFLTFLADPTEHLMLLYGSDDTVSLAIKTPDTITLTPDQVESLKQEFAEWTDPQSKTVLADKFRFSLYQGKDTELARANSVKVQTGRKISLDELSLGIHGESSFPESSKKRPMKKGVESQSSIRKIVDRMMAPSPQEERVLNALDMQMQESIIESAKNPVLRAISEVELKKLKDGLSVSDSR